ncbi:hypothetical protein T8J41_00700 [Nitratireductor rhodophyticola]|uniref:DUF6538 domain-containing protein n=1 Tax=Nitratireductor rhodophyticola TaxID=2854036 RepID=UPI002AC94DBC|nr:DUF6538 domain-containing protein [Nitratireductor rhodophyticola]WPZ14390.1 hypothetical protein T8J41_00700 [Nitratireductor rhodophyticola]
MAVHVLRQVHKDSLMAARHRIANLTRRGNVFYWRARVPSAFTSNQRSHLALSLRHGDHTKAKSMVRRLNMLLAELAEEDRARMTSREQLEDLFRTEIERMNESIDDLAFAARRTGSTAEDNVRADILIGWVYRLIQLFGTGRPMRFDASCPARHVLEQAGFAESQISEIAATFDQERKECRTAYFEGFLKSEMNAHGLKDTPLNRERATQQIMRAKADVLLGAPDRYGPLSTDSDVAALFGAPKQPQTSALETAPSPAPAAANTNPDDAPAIGLPSLEQVPPAQVSAPAYSASVPASPTPKGAASQQPQPAPASAPAPEVIAPAVESPPAPVIDDEKGVDLPLSQFITECDALMKSNQHHWEEATAKDVKVAVTMLVGVLEEQGITHSSQMRQIHLGKLREHFDHILTNYGRSPRLRSLGTAALRAASAEAVRSHKEAGKEPPKLGLGPTTIRKHLANINTFLTYIKGRGYNVPNLTMDGLRPRKPKLSDARRITDKPGPEQLRPMFDMPLYTGCKSATEQELTGPHIFHSANYFLPMLMVYLGPRRNEVAGLAVKDVVKTSQGWAIDIRPNQFRSLKNASSARMLPVPDEVLRLNFIDYVEAIKALRYDALFPELFAKSRRTDPGDRFYKDFVPKLHQHLGDAERWNRVLHALRHGFADTLKQALVHPSIISDIAGRLGSDETSMRYTNRAGLNVIKDALEKYPSVTNHLEPQPIRLLPWVEAREAAPWEGRTKGERLRRIRRV